MFRRLSPIVEKIRFLFVHGQYAVSGHITNLRIIPTDFYCLFNVAVLNREIRLLKFISEKNLEKTTNGYTVPIGSLYSVPNEVPSPRVIMMVSLGFISSSCLKSRFIVNGVNVDLSFPKGKAN